MSIANNPYQLYKLLPGDNCGRCYLPACMAFAAAVIRGDKRLADCPRLDKQTRARLEAELRPRRGLSQEQEAAAAELSREVAGLDFIALAARTGGTLRADGRLALSCLGKDFYLNPDGRLSSECHINPWVQLPLLRYFLVCRGVPEQGQWLPLAELAGGAAAAPLFAKRCEEPLRRLADSHGDHFFALLAMFAACEVRRRKGELVGDEAGESRLVAVRSEGAEGGEGERIILLRPLPLVPLRLVYQPPEEDLASALRIYFDRSAEENANPEILNFLGTGIAVMVEKIFLRPHSC